MTRTRSGRTLAGYLTPMEYINSCGELREGWDRHDLSVHAGWLDSVRGRVSGHEGSVAFLMKDFVLFAASLYLLKQDVARVSQGVEQGDVAAASKSVEAMR